MRFPALSALALLGCPALVAGQSPSPVARFDAAVSIGGFGMQHEEASWRDRWTHDIAGHVSAGLYWTDHLKSEFEIGWTGESAASGVELVSDVSRPRPVYFLHRYQNRLFSVGQVYQFGRNAFFHPFVAAGVSVDRERHTIDRAAQQVYLPGPPIRVLFLPAVLEVETRVRGRPFAAAGFKAYMSRQTFFKSEMKLAVRDRIEQLTLKVGVGIDF